MNTSAVNIDPSTMYWGCGGKSMSFEADFSTGRGAYAKISRPVPRSKVPEKDASRSHTPASKACRNPSFAPTKETRRRLEFRLAKLVYECPGLGVRSCAR